MFRGGGCTALTYVDQLSISVLPRQMCLAKNDGNWGQVERQGSLLANGSATPGECT